MNRDLVSVIMPAYNAEKFISEAINSVIQQTYTNWELIVVDDGSADHTAAIIKDHLANDSRIQYLRQDNGGQGKARNYGIKQAKGQYIAFLDADDIWVPDRLLIQMRMISVNRVDLVFSDAYIFEGKPKEKEKLNIAPGYYHGEEAIHKLLHANYVPLLTVLTKRTAILSVNGFSELRDIHEDYDLWIRMLINGSSFLGFNMPLAYYRIHFASSSSGEGKMLFFTINNLERIKSIYPKYSMDINLSLYDLIHDHLNKINFSRWEVTKQFLLARKQITNDKTSLSFWKTVHTVAGGRIFRILFGLRVKLFNGKAKEENSNAAGVVFRAGDKLKSTFI